MIHLIYIYLILNSFLTGYSWTDSDKDIVSKMIHFLGLFVAIPFIIIQFLWLGSKEVWDWTNGYFQISFIWLIRNGHFEKFDEEDLARINERRDKRLKKEKLSFRDKRYIYCVNKINEVVKLNKEIKDGEDTRIN